MSRKKSKSSPKKTKFNDPFMDDDPEPLPKGFKIDEIDHDTKRVDNNAFFKSMFSTFGITLLVFMGLLVLLFIVKWITGN